jgi:RNA polymerase sigma-70 factor (ECF subfamily)
MVLEDRDLDIAGNDQAIVQACRRGEPDAFRALFETYKDRVYSIALRYSGDATAAMDIAQETFLKLLSSIGEFRGEANFETFLFRMVVNRCLDYHRRRRRLMPLVTDLFHLVRAPGDTALHDLLRSEFESSVQEVVATLAPEQRIVVVLRYTEGLSYEQIGEILGCSTGTVGSRLNRAHKVLERRLSHLRSSRKEAEGGGW